MTLIGRYRFHKMVAIVSLDRLRKFALFQRERSVENRRLHRAKNMVVEHAQLTISVSAFGMLSDHRIKIGAFQNLPAEIRRHGQSVGFTARRTEGHNKFPAMNHAKRLELAGSEHAFFDFKANIFPHFGHGDMICF